MTYHVIHVYHVTYRVIHVYHVTLTMININARCGDAVDCYVQNYLFKPSATEGVQIDV